MITSISARNFKGRSFDQKLAPVTLLAGQNFTGKTAHIQAVVLALAGYVPDVAKKTNEIFAELANASPMFVEAVTGKFSIGRTYSEERDGKIKCVVSSDGVASDFAVPPVLVDANEYFQLSDAERVKFIFSRLSSAANRSAVAATVIANVKNIKLEPHTPDAEAAVQDAASDLSNYFANAATNGQAGQDLVEEIVKDFAEKKRTTEANAKRLGSTIEGMTQLSTVTAPAVNVDGALSSARRDLESANATSAGAAQEVRSLESRLSAVRAAAAAVVDEAEVLAEIDRLTREREAYAKVTPPPEFNAGDAVPTPAQAQRLTELSALKATLFTAIQQTPVDPTEDRRRLETFRRNRDYAAQRDRELINEILRLRRELETTTAEKCCSTCGQSIEKLREQVVADLQTKIQALEAKMASISAVVAVAQGNFEVAEQAVKLADENVRLHRENSDLYRRTDEEHRGLRESVVNAHRIKWDGLNREVAQAQRAIIQRDSQIAAHRSKLDDKTAANAAAEVPRIEGELETYREKHRIAASTVARCRGVVADLESRQREHTRQRAEQATRDAAIAEATKAKAEAQVARQVCDLLNSLQATLIDDAINPLLTTVNSICAGILPRPLAYRDRRIGFELPSGKIVTHKAMSGCERALTFCALSIALAAESPLKLLILDELGRIDSANKIKLVQNLCSLVRDGVLDQCLLADVSSDSFTVFTPESNFKKRGVDPELTKLGFSIIEL